MVEDILYTFESYLFALQLLARRALRVAPLDAAADVLGRRCEVNCEAPLHTFSPPSLAARKIRVEAALPEEQVHVLRKHSVGALATERSKSSSGGNCDLAKRRSRSRNLRRTLAISAVPNLLLTRAHTFAFNANVRAVGKCGRRRHRGAVSAPELPHRRGVRSIADKRGAAANAAANHVRLWSRWALRWRGSSSCSCCRSGSSSSSSKRRRCRGGSFLGGKAFFHVRAQDIEWDARALRVGGSDFLQRAVHRVTAPREQVSRKHALNRFLQSRL